MKTITCKQMGGTCDAQFTTKTGDEAIKAFDKHLREVVADDASHQKALNEMDARWKNPVAGMKWYLKTKKDFAALPEN